MMLGAESMIRRRCRRSTRWIANSAGRISSKSRSA